MRNQVSPYIAKLLCLLAYASASESFNLPIPAPLTAANLTTPPTNTSTSLSAISTFPPSPPPLILRYHVPDSNITIKFSRHNYVPQRCETDVKKVLEDVIMDSVGYTDRAAAIPDYEREWESRDIVLWLQPERDSADQKQVLTWGLWTVTLRGIRGYISAYPGLFFSYQVYVGEDGVTERWLVGFGSLTRYVSGG